MQQPWSHTGSAGRVDTVHLREVDSKVVVQCRPSFNSPGDRIVAFEVVHGGELVEVDGLATVPGRPGTVRIDVDIPGTGVGRLAQQRVSVRYDPDYLARVPSKLVALGDERPACDCCIDSARYDVDVLLDHLDFEVDRDSTDDDLRGMLVDMDFEELCRFRVTDVVREYEVTLPEIIIHGEWKPVHPDKATSPME